MCGDDAAVWQNKKSKASWDGFLPAWANVPGPQKEEQTEQVDIYR